MYSPVTCEADKIKRLEKNLLRAPKKASVAYEENQSGGAISSFDPFMNSKDNYYCDTTGYTNYLNEI